MPRNTLGDLANHLFAELERLGDESLAPEQLADEIERARAVGAIASQVIANANTMLRAVEFRDAALDPKTRVPALLGPGDGRDEGGEGL